MAVSGKSLRAGKAVIELSLIKGPVEAQLKSLQSKLRGVGNTLTSIGKKGLAVGGVLATAFAAATGFFFPAKSTANLCTRCADIDVGNAAIRSGGGKKLFRLPQVEGHD